LRSIVVQAALLAAGSLAPDVVRGLVRRPALARRYLAVEGHRALASQEAMLPTTLGSLIDHAVAARSVSPAASLAIAMSRETLADAPEVFGTIRPRDLRAGVEPAAEERTAHRHVARRGPGDLLHELDDDDDDV